MQIAPEQRNSSATKQMRRGLARWLIRFAQRAAGKVADMPPRIPRSGVHRILIVRSAKTLGETLLLTPLLRAIEVVYPGAEVDIVSRCGVADILFATYFQVRHVYVLPGRVLREPLRFLRSIRNMRKARYDLAIDPYLLSHSDRTLVMLARARYKLGFDGRRKSGHLTHPVAEPAQLEHAGKLPVFLLRSATGHIEDPAASDYPGLDLRLTASERERGGAALSAVLETRAPARGVIGVYAFATGAKRFDHAWWQRFLPLIESHFFDHAIVEIVPMFATSLLDSRYPTYYSSDPRKLAAVLANLTLFVSADCGVMHLACASGAPTVGIFSVTDIPGWSVYGPGCTTIDARGRSPEQIAEEIVRTYGGGKLAEPDPGI